MVKRRKRASALDVRKLVREIQQGTSAAELKKKYGLKTTTQIRNLYFRGLIQTGVVPDIKTGRSRKEAKELTIRKRGSLIIPRDMVEELGYKTGDSFLLRKRKTSIILSKKL